MYIQNYFLSIEACLKDLASLVKYFSRSIPHIGYYKTQRNVNYSVCFNYDDFLNFILFLLTFSNSDFF